MRYCFIMNNEKQTSQLSFKLISTVVPFQTKWRCCNIFIKTQRPLEFLHWLESGRTRFLRGSTRKQKLTFAEVSPERHEDRKRPGRWVDGLPDARRGMWAGFYSPPSALRWKQSLCLCVLAQVGFRGMLLPSLLLLGRVAALPFILLHGHQTLSLFCFFFRKWSYVSGNTWCVWDSNKHHFWMLWFSSSEEHSWEILPSVVCDAIN